MIVLKSVRNRLERVLFSPDGADIVAPTYGGIQVWRPFIAGGKPRVLPVPCAYEVYFTPDGGKLFAAANTIWTVDYASGTAALLPLDQHSGSYGMRFVLSHTGDRCLLESIGVGVSLRTVGGATVWTRPGVQWWGQPRFLPGDAEFAALVVEGHSRREQKFRIVVCDTATGNEVWRSDPLAGEVSDWVVSPDGERAACRTTVWARVYPLREPFAEPLAVLRNDNRKEFTGIAFHPSGKYLAVTSNDETVKLYDTTNWQVAKTYTWNAGRMRSVAFSPDGSLAAAGSEKGQVVVWDVDL